MAAVWMYIEKFKGKVLIDDDHPLAVAQKEKPAPAAVVEDVDLLQPVPRRRKGR